MYVDFHALKQQVSVEAVADMLGLKLAQDGSQWRGPCPRCREGGERALAVTPGKGFYCFASNLGGDCIALAAHILNRSMKEAAAHILAQRTTAPAADTDEVATEPKRMEPLGYLLYDHEEVQALGVDAETAAALGMGYAKKGIMRGRVAIPLRTNDGTLVGYCGYSPEADPPLKFPKTIGVG